jgi:hypothetical protein
MIIAYQGYKKGPVPGNRVGAFFLMISYLL